MTDRMHPGSPGRLPPAPTYDASALTSGADVAHAVELGLPITIFGVVYVPENEYTPKHRRGDD